MGTFPTTKDQSPKAVLTSYILHTTSYMLWRFLIQSLLHNVARQKVQEAVVEAAQQQFSAKPEASERRPVSDACHAACIFALGIESGSLEDTVGPASSAVKASGFTVRRGEFRGRNVVIALSGAGRQKAAHAADAVIAAHRPRLVVSAGFGGGLNAELRHNDIVVGSSVKLADGTELMLSAEVPFSWPRLFTGRLLTVDQVVRLPSEKRSLGTAHGAWSVDMETYAVAEVCQRLAVPCLAVRVVIDAVDDELPPHLERLMEQKTKAAQVGAALGAFLNRPSVAIDLYKLKEKGILASARLAKFLAELIARQPA